MPEYHATPVFPLSLTPVKSDSNLSVLSESEDTVSTALSESSFEPSSRRVSFGAIHIREYERIIGDHPDTRVGVPMSIGWGYVERKEVSIDQYEADHVPRTNLRMSSITRKNILHNIFGFSEEELRAAEKENEKTKKRREQAMQKGISALKSKSKLTSFGRKLKKVLNTEAFLKGLAFAASNGMMVSMSH